MASPLMSPDLDTSIVEEEEKPWLVMLANDPVNGMDYVARALKKVFGYSAEKANTLMLVAHHEGRVPVWSGEREKAESYATALHSYSLWATVTQDK